MNESIRAGLVKVGAIATVAITGLQGLLDVHIPALTALVEANPNASAGAIATYFIGLHLARSK